MRNILVPLALSVFTALPAAAQESGWCEELWFTRNLIFDRAGQCFVSPLGRALFDNSDCAGTDIALSDHDQVAVARIRETERFGQCAVDSDQTTLTDLAEFETMYRTLRDIPAGDSGESACIGYRGQPLVLRAGADAAARVISRVSGGETILFAHFSRNGWDFVTVHAEGADKGRTGYGWAPFGGGPPDCDGYAG